MKLFGKLPYKILLFSSLFLALIITFFSFIIINNQNESDQINSISEPTEFCGTKSLPVKAQEGKQIFNSNCAACHKLDAKITGPALRNVDSTVFSEWINTSKVRIDTTKLDKLGIDYHRNLSSNLSKSDSKKIYEYLVE